MGGGKKGGGGGGGQLPAFQTPQGLFQGAAAETGLGQYGQSILNPLAAMTSWASTLATGQPTSVPTPGAFAIQAGPAVQFGHGEAGRGGWASSFDPTTGLITFSNPANPAQTFQTALSKQINPGGYGEFGDLPQAVLNQWLQAYQQYQQYKQGTAPQQTPQSALAQNPQLSLAWQDIQAQQAATQQIPGLEAQTQGFVDQANQQAQALYGKGYDELTAAEQQLVNANALVGMTTTGEGLFPAQQAYIEQARQSEETQLASTLGAAGLGRSTQLDQLKGAADLAAAATAGQLQQGNIQAATGVVSAAVAQQTAAQQTLGLAQTAQKLSLTGQELLATEQAQLVQELQNITTQSVQMQQALWNEAIQGYGAMGAFIDTSAKSYGYSLSAYSNILQAMEQQTGYQAGLQQAQMQADQQSTSSLFGGLGQLFGSGGAGSNLLGGLGGLFGAGAGAAGGAAAAAGAGGIASGAAGIAAESAITAVGAAL